MREDNFKNEIEKRWGGYEKRRHKGRIWTGALLFLIGGLLLLKSANLMFFPGWFFTWPMLFIAIGLISGFKHNFRGPFWIIMLMIGGITLADNLNPALNLDRFMWPVIIMAVGLIFILRPKRSRCANWDYPKTPGNPDNLTSESAASGTGFTNMSSSDSADGDRRDFVDVTAVFGGVKKNILTKTFKGGDIVSFMGGSEIDLTQADFNGRVRIDVTNIFGGTKLIVPPTWDVQSDITAIFGGVDDKRLVSNLHMDPNKVLVLDGTCMFGGLEIRSF